MSNTTRLPGGSVLTDSCVAMFGGAAARAAIFELRARLFADAVPELQSSSRENMDPLMAEILPWLERETTATEQQREHLQRCARLRNRLFHADFSRVTGQLVAFGASLEQGNVKRFTVHEPVTEESFRSAIEEGGVPVTKTKTKQGLHYGWLLEASSSGSFGEAARIFDEGAELLASLLQEWTTKQAGKAR